MKRKIEETQLELELENVKKIKQCIFEIYSPMLSQINFFNDFDLKDLCNLALTSKIVKNYVTPIIQKIYIDKMIAQFLFYFHTEFVVEPELTFGPEEFKSWLKAEFDIDEFFSIEESCLQHKSGKKINPDHSISGVHCGANCSLPDHFWLTKEFKQQLYDKYTLEKLIEIIGYIEFYILFRRKITYSRFNDGLKIQNLDCLLDNSKEGSLWLKFENLVSKSARNFQSWKYDSPKFYYTAPEYIGNDVTWQYNDSWIWGEISVKDKDCDDDSIIYVPSRIPKNSYGRNRQFVPPYDNFRESCKHIFKICLETYKKSQLKHIKKLAKIFSNI